MSVLKYKNYVGMVEVDAEAGVLHGTVIGTRDVVTFEADTVRGIAKAFHDSVDDYLDFCRRKNRAPDRPYSGRMVLRMPTELHRKLDTLSRTRRSSINRLAVELLEREVEVLA